MHHHDTTQEVAVSSSGGANPAGPVPLYIRPKHAAARYGVSLPMFWRLVAKGVLPQPWRRGPRCSMWRTSELDAAFRAWIEGPAGGADEKRKAAVGG